jgi:hypothetical protein
VEWPESKPAGWRTELAAEKRGGLTGAGGFHGGANRAAGSDGGGAEEQLRVLARSDLWWLNDGSMVAQWQRRAEEEKGLFRGGLLL